MNSSSDNPELTGPASTPGMEFSPPPVTPSVPTGPRGTSAPKAQESHPYDFRTPALLPPRELRKLRMLHEDFVEALAARLSLYLRLEVSLKITGLNTIAYQKLVESWADPSHLTIFKIEPLRGVAIIEVPPRLGLSLVDRLMGGPGQAPDPAPEITEIERALLEQIVQLILNEWSAHWAKVKSLTPVILGHESNGRFVQTAPPETIMFVVSLETSVGEVTDKIQIGLPFASIDPLVRQLSQGPETMSDSAHQPAKPATAWNPGFDEIPVPVTAEWPVTEITAGEVIALKVGDVLRIDPQNVAQVCLRIGDLPRYIGRPGTIAGKWAIELTKVINP